VTVVENSEIGAEVFSFTVSDADDDPLSVGINYDNQFELRETIYNGYTLLVRESLDREKENRYKIIITIDDSKGGVVSI